MVASYLFFEAWQRAKKGLAKYAELAYMCPMKIAEALKLISAAFRTQAEAARWLGFGRDNWGRYCRGERQIPPRTAYYIIGKAEELMASMQGVKTSAKEAANGD